MCSSKFFDRILLLNPLERNAGRSCHFRSSGRGSFCPDLTNSFSKLSVSFVTVSSILFLCFCASYFLPRSCCVRLYLGIVFLYVRQVCVFTAGSVRAPRFAMALKGRYFQDAFPAILAVLIPPNGALVGWRFEGKRRTPMANI